MSRAGPPSGGLGASRAEAKGGSSVGPPSGGPGAAGGGRLPGGRRAARVPPAPAPGRGRRRGKDPALADRAPEPLDLRLAPTALTAWGVAAWAVARPAGSWRSLSVLAALAGLLALVLLRPVLRFRAARHRDDPRPGSQSPDVPPTWSRAPWRPASCCPSWQGAPSWAPPRPTSGPAVTTP